MPREVASEQIHGELGGRPCVLVEEVHDHDVDPLRADHVHMPMREADGPPRIVAESCRPVVSLCKLRESSLPWLAVDLLPLASLLVVSS